MNEDKYVIQVCWLHINGLANEEIYLAISYWIIYAVELCAFLIPRNKTSIKRNSLKCTNKGPCLALRSPKKFEAAGTVKSRLSERRLSEHY